MLYGFILRRIKALWDVKKSAGLGSRHYGKDRARHARLVPRHNPGPHVGKHKVAPVPDERLTLAQKLIKAQKHGFSPRRQEIKRVFNSRRTLPKPPAPNPPG